MGTEATDVRLAWLEGAYEQVDKRLGTIENRLAVLESKVDAGFARLDAKIDGKIDMLASELREADSRLDAKMDAGFARLDAKMDAGFTRTNAPVDSLGARLNIVMFGIVVVILEHILLRIFWP